MVLDCTSISLSGIVVASLAYAVFSRAKERRERKRLIEAAYERWLEASVEHGRLMERNPYRSASCPERQDLLRKELEAYQKYLSLKGAKSELEARELARMKAEIA